MVGKNNKQNDYLTMKLAGKQNIWLHTKDIPGSHVVIRSDAPSEATLNEAALLAAYFSKAQQSSAVPVDYTEIKHVHKPNGAKPGYVIYDHQKTVAVTPNRAIVEQLKENDQAHTH
ncbi:NFACT RNA binding domain-containing protein [Halolactibacillus sp. JCM 19043]|uniref:NFACT RNA binding domain-containing protein n=1 Tax=Halolactibacillus sp. JCM 19043 TaxID=1460638 RepID=UPI000A810E7C